MRKAIVKKWTHGGEKAVTVGTVQFIERCLIEKINEGKQYIFAYKTVYFVEVVDNEIRAYIYNKLQGSLGYTLRGRYHMYNKDYADHLINN